MNMNEFDDVYEDKQRVQGAIVTEPISVLKPAIAVTVRPTTTVLEAVKVMNQKKCGCVCVTEGDKLVGIFTERDVLTKVVEQALDTKKTTVDKGKLTGIISIRDIADFMVALFPDDVLNVPPDPSLGIPTRPDGG